MFLFFVSLFFPSRLVCLIIFLMFCQVRNFSQQYQQLFQKYDKKNELFLDFLKKYAESFGIRNNEIIYAAWKRYYQNQDFENFALASLNGLLVLFI